MLDKPAIDRQKLQEVEERRHHMIDVAESASRLIGPGETLNRPVRKDDRIIFTIRRDRETQRRTGRPPQVVREKSVRYT